MIVDQRGNTNQDTIWYWGGWKHSWAYTVAREWHIKWVSGSKWYLISATICRSVRATWTEDVQDSKTPVYPFQAFCHPPNCLRGQPSPEYYLRHGYWHVQLVQWRETWGSRKVDSRMTFRFPDVNPIYNRSLTIRTHELMPTSVQAAIDEHLSY